jgi:hypothetical protein
MGRNSFKAKGRRDSPTFVRFEHRMLKHPRFLALSGAAVKVLLFLAGEYNGTNNGDLSIAIKLTRKAGLPGSSNLRRAAQELVDAGFLVLTRRGARHRCNLFALSWFAIDACDGKLDIPATRTAPNHWLWDGDFRGSPEAQSAPPGAQSLPSPPFETQH